MVRQVKVLATNTADLNYIPRTYMVKMFNEFKELNTHKIVKMQ